MSKEQTTKPNCYECVYRGEVPGSAHSCCEHPDTQDARSSPMSKIVGIIGGGMPIPSKAWKTLKVVGVSHGVRMGWFGWPLNFDPTWLEHCDGFKAKEQ